jgi:hypothetical protein
VLEFENGLKDKLIPFGLKEKEKLLQLKAEEKKELGHSFDGEINAWDFRYQFFLAPPVLVFFAHLSCRNDRRYYHRLLLEKEYEVNDDEIKEYFPIEVVTKALLGMLASFSYLLACMPYAYVTIRPSYNDRDLPGDPRLPVRGGGEALRVARGRATLLRLRQGLERLYWPLLSGPLPEGR